MDHGTDINTTTNEGDTPLILACIKGHSSITKLLLDRGCNVNAVDPFGYTALHDACCNGYTECVKELLAHGADTSIKNNGGKTPLDKARHNKHDAVVALLLEEEKTRAGQKNMNRDQGENTTEVATIMSELSTINDEVSECVAFISGRKRLSSSMVETNILDQRCDKRKFDMIDSQEAKEIKKLRSDLNANAESRNHRSTLFEDKISQSFEILTNKLAISNSEVAVKCISKLSAMMGHLSSKVDAIEEKVNQLCRRRNEEMTTSEE